MDELEALGASYADSPEFKAVLAAASEDDPFLESGLPFGPVFLAVKNIIHDDWTTKNRISCPAVDTIATLIAAGQESRPASTTATWRLLATSSTTERTSFGSTGTMSARLIVVSVFA
jgi:hypothetical protein